MTTTDAGTYRVLPGPPDEEGFVLLEQWSEEPVTVQSEGDDDPLASAVESLQPGHLVDATVEWPPEGTPAIADLAVRTETVCTFVGDADHVFEKAEETFTEARRDRAPIASTVTYNTDGEANGALYTIAKQGGGTDIFAQFRDGRRTLEPMIDKLGEGGAEPPYEVFVVRPADEQFVFVYLAIEKGGLLANTIREEYDLAPL
ncbi:MAG: hypothetical protein ACI8XM_002847 [Haloarculaceae archaeon]|jgi:hypothetical protein